MPNRAIAEAVGMTRPTVLLWRARFAAAGVLGLLRERPRRGRKPAMSPERIHQVVEATLYTTPAGAPPEPEPGHEGRGEGHPSTRERVRHGRLPPPVR